jgi:hypothetical protein
VEGAVIDTASRSVSIALSLAVGAHLHDWKYLNPLIAIYLLMAVVCLVLHGYYKWQKGRRS